MRGLRKYCMAFILSVALIFTGVFSGLALAVDTNPSAPVASRQLSVKMGRFIVAIVLEELTFNNIQDSEIRDLMRAAIQGMIKEVDDPEAILLNPDDYEEMVNKFLEEGKPTISWRTVGDGIGHIRISCFAETTTKEFKRALQELSKGSIILDLRNNSGGSAVAAAEVAEEFLDMRGRLIFSMRRRPGEDTVYATSREGTFKGHLVVLVNAQTAAAAEVLAGSLQDYHCGPVVGVKTASMGSVLRVLPLPDGGAFVHTVYHFYTPGGKDIQGNGITPDIIIDNPPSGEDVQLQKAIDVLKLKKELEPVG